MAPLWNVVRVAGQEEHSAAASERVIDCVFALMIFEMGKGVQTQGQFRKNRYMLLTGESCLSVRPL